MDSYPIVFVRHGESEANVFLHDHDPNADEKINRLGDPKLSKLGQKQAECVGKGLIDSLTKMGTPNVNVLVSQFTRAVETSNYFTENYPNIDNMLITNSLLEYTPTKKNLSQIHLNSGLNHDHTWDQFKERIVKFCDEYFTSPPKSPMIIFGHSMFISCLVTYISSHRTFFPDKNQLCFRFPNCSITTFLWDGERNRWVADHVASIAHMDVKLITGTHTPFGNKSIVGMDKPVGVPVDKYGNI